MPPIVSSIDIARPPDVVFSYATDPTRFAEWQRDVVDVRVEADRPPGVGARFTTIRRVGGAERTMTQEITELDPPRSWAAHGVDGPIRPAASITVEPLDDGARSRVGRQGGLPPRRRRRPGGPGGPGRLCPADPGQGPGRLGAAVCRHLAHLAGPLAARWSTVSRSAG
jgi:uncharacterized protein YndB with AHSA1/START domain